MSNDQNLFNKNTGDPELISFGQKLVGSQAFFQLFEQGMSLVEEAANYLDGEGRAASKVLERDTSLAYASESMRLTTRLMQLASWLLVQRAVNEGEMTIEQAQDEQRKVTLSAVASDNDGNQWNELPEKLRDMVERSIRLQSQIMTFDKALHGQEEPEAAMVNPISSHISLLEQAFGQ